MKKTNEGSLGFVIGVTCVAAIGGLLFGYDTAVISGAIGFLSTHFELTSAMMGWAASSALVGCMIGVLLAGFLSDKFGRKKTLIICAILFLVSAIGSALPQTLTSFIIYRIIGGIGVGAASMTCPMYIAEISPARIRGRMVSVNQFAIVSGMLIVYFVNYFIAGIRDEGWNIDTGWRWMFGSEAIPAILFLFLLCFVPESPRWLFENDKQDDALRILTRVDGFKNAQKEMEEISKTIRCESGSILELFGKSFRPALYIGVFLAVFQQITGINVFLYYAPEIFKSVSKSNINIALLQTIVIGIVNIAFTIIAICTVDKLGRKPLMIIGSIGMGASLAMLGIGAYLNTVGAWLLVFVLGYIACFELSAGPVIWVILSEIFPTKVRGRALGFATFCLWTANYFISQTFPMMEHNQWLIDKFHHAFPFWLYAFFCVILTLFMIFKVPETKGKTLEEIERFWLSREQKPEGHKTQIQEIC